MVIFDIMMPKKNDSFVFDHERHGVIRGRVLDVVDKTIDLELIAPLGGKKIGELLTINLGFVRKKQKITNQLSS